MNRNRKFIEREFIVDKLNQIHELDPTVLPALIEFRVPCNKALADDPEVQVGVTNDDKTEVGFLGILNGVSGAKNDGWGYISAVITPEGKISHFRILEDLDETS